LNSQIILGGDSAGGNLTLAILSHRLHPLSGIIPLSNNENFKGVLLISPWVAFDQSAGSFQSNANKDYLSRAALKAWSDAFIGGAAVDNYNTPLEAEPEWWEDLPASEVFVTAGADEVLLDDIKECTSKLKVSNYKATENIR
jgi:acetyl esterase/lipase